MLEYIFKSKVRVKLFRLFFTDTSTEIHIRGIVRKIDEEINAVRRELQNLEEAGILESEKRGNKLYYKIDTKCPIRYELIGLVHKEFGLGKIVLTQLENLGDVTYAVLTTAYLENEHPSPNDIDILLVGNFSMKGVSQAIKTAEKELSREIRYTVMTEEEYEYRKKKRDSFILNIIHKHKIMLVGDENKLMT
jgi:DNA-binding transcriptional ArsR family regulator